MIKSRNNEKSIISSIVLLIPYMYMRVVDTLTFNG